MSGNGTVWQPFVDGLTGWRWSAPDLPGHGGSDRLDSYGYATAAAALVPCLPPGSGPLVVVGHSLGGVIGLALAALVPVREVVTVGMRVDWPTSFVALLDSLADRPRRVFADRGEAAAFLLRVNGLAAPTPFDAAFVTAGLRRVDGGWEVAQDPASFGMGAPDFDALFGSAVAAGARVRSAFGATDAMVAVGDYDRYAAAYGVQVDLLPRLGHNAHVEDPAAVRRLLPAPHDPAAP